MASTPPPVSPSREDAAWFRWAEEQIAGNRINIKNATRRVSAAEKQSSSQASQSARQEQAIAPKTHISVAPEGLTLVSNVGGWNLDGSVYSTIVLEWENVGRTTEGAVVQAAEYEVWQSVEGEAPTRVTAVRSPRASFAVPAGFTYEFTVRARTQEGVWGAYSEPLVVVSALPPLNLGAPSKPTLISGGGVVIVSWDGLLDGQAAPEWMSRVTVQRQEGSSWLTIGSIREGSFSDAGLTAGDTETYRLVAVDVLGRHSDPSPTESILVLGVGAGDIDQAIIDAIDQAQSDADAAQTTADGKNTNYYAATAPTGGTYKDGDTWFDTANGNRISVRQGSSWVPASFGTNALANNAVNASKLASNAVTNAKIANGAVNSDKLATAVNDSISTAQSTATNAQDTADGAQALAEYARRTATAALRASEELAVNSSFENGALWPGSGGILSEPLGGIWLVGVQSDLTTYVAETGNRIGQFRALVPAGATLQFTVDVPITTGAPLPDLKVTVTLSDNDTVFTFPITTPGSHTLSGRVTNEWGLGNGTIRINTGAMNGVDQFIGIRSISVKDITDLVAAEEAADFAQSIAEAAQLAADAAQGAADDAQDAADAAQLTANGKNKVTRSTAVASGAGSAGDQWFRYSGSEVIGFWIHNGTSWISQTLTDAVISNLDAGTITAGTISSDRIGAASITGTHIAGATVTASNMVAGTITAASGIIADAAIGSAQIANLAVTNAKIANGTIQNAKIANLDAGKITTGYLDVANRVQAGAITTSKLVVADMENQLDDPEFEAGTWNGLDANRTIVSITDHPVRGSAKVLQIVATSSGQAVQNDRWVPCEPGDMFYGEALVRKTTNDNSGQARIDVQFRKKDGSFMYPSFANQGLGGLTIDQWVKISGTVEVPADVYEVRMRLLLPAGTSSGTVQFGSPRMRRMNGGELIIDGVVVARHITMDEGFANKFWANEGNFNKITVNMLEPNFGETLNISGNGEILLIADRIEATETAIGTPAAGSDPATGIYQDIDNVSQNVDTVSQNLTAVNTTASNAVAAANAAAATAAAAANAAAEHSVGLRVKPNYVEVGREGQDSVVRIAPTQVTIGTVEAATTTWSGGQMVVPEIIADKSRFGNLAIERYGDNTVFKVVV